MSKTLIGGSPQSAVLCVGLGGAFILSPKTSACWRWWALCDGFSGCAVQLYLGAVPPKSGYLSTGEPAGEGPSVRSLLLTVPWALLLFWASSAPRFWHHPLAPGWPLEQRALLQQPHAFCLPSNPTLILKRKALPFWRCWEVGQEELLLQGEWVFRKSDASTAARVEPSPALELPSFPFSELGPLPCSRTNSMSSRAFHPGTFPPQQNPWNAFEAALCLLCLALAVQRGWKWSWRSSPEDPPSPSRNNKWLTVVNSHSVLSPC